MNIRLLKAKFVEMGVTQEAVAKAAGMSSNSLSRKMLGKRDFRLKEIVGICSYLHPVLTADDAVKIFLSKTAQKGND